MRTPFLLFSYSKENGDSSTGTTASYFESNPEYRDPYRKTNGKGKQMKKNMRWLIAAAFGLVAAVSLSAEECEPCGPYPLIADQDLEVGTLSVFNDADGNLLVEFKLADDGVLMETQLHVALSIDGIPSNRRNVPIPGQFAYKTYHESGVNEFTYVIPSEELPELDLGASYWIAAHADTAWQSGGEWISEGAWAGCEPVTSSNRWWFVAEFVPDLCQEEEFVPYIPNLAGIGGYISQIPDGRFIYLFAVNGVITSGVACCPSTLEVALSWYPTRSTVYLPAAIYVFDGTYFNSGEIPPLTGVDGYILQNGSGGFSLLPATDGYITSHMSLGVWSSVAAARSNNPTLNLAFLPSAKLEDFLD